MTIKTFQSLDSLCAHARKHSDQYDTISFDVFDTLFVRRVHDPDLVKQPVARYINALAKKAGAWSSYDSVEKTRNSIEGAHRQVNGKQNPDYEANYAQFMPEVLQAVFAEHYSAEVLEKVTDYEVAMENAMLVARDEIIALLEFLKQQNKKILLISDMYLPSGIIRRLVVNKGLEHFFDDIVSSADTFRAKASGTAYPLVKEKHELDESRWLHIGDHAFSDGLRADEFGLDALVIDDLSEKKRKGLAKRYHFYAKRQNLWKGRYVQQLMLPLEGENIERSELYADGYQFFAYLFGYAIVQLKERADLLGIKKVYFCAREGWMLKRCWEIMAPILWPENADEYELHYLYVSRLSLAQASRANAGLSLFDAENALRPTHNRDFTDIARVYGLDIDKLNPFLQRYDLAIDEELSSEKRSMESFKKLIALCDDEEFNQCIKDIGQPHARALHSYLEEINFFSDQRVAITDIGWLSTIQHYLVSAIEDRKDKPIVNGFLVSTDNAQFYGETAYSETQGLIFDTADFSSIPWLMTSCKDVFEEVTRAEHTTLLGYEPDAKKGYRLRFRDETDESAKAEIEQFEHYKDVHSGVFDGVKRFAAAVSVAHFNVWQLNYWCQLLIMGRLGFPKSKEIQRLKNFAHQDDFARAAEGATKKSRLIKKIERMNASIWSEPMTAVRYMPLLRLRHFLKFMRRVRRR